MIKNIDIIISVGYVLGIVTIGLWAGLGKKKIAHGNESNDYFLAGKSLRWPMIGLALFATNISCLHLVSLAQSGFDTGLLNGNFEWMAAFTLILLALFFVPFYIKSKVATLPDFLEKRYNKACRDWLAVSMVTGLKPEKLKYYKQLHTGVWPAVLKKIKACNIQNYSIYQQKTEEKYFLFSYFEYAGNNFDADIKNMASDKTTQRWWKETNPCLLPLPEDASNGEIWTAKEEVFHT